VSVARREFEEEVGPLISQDDLRPLGSVALRSGKVVHAWACAGDFDPGEQSSNTFRMEWPPRSGREADYPEVDRVEWFSTEAARRKLNPAQVVFIDRLLEVLNGRL
jgi:predicted NUDIX family NTP pyrophosphohydrolase